MIMEAEVEEEVLNKIKMEGEEDSFKDQKITITTSIVNQEVEDTALEEENFQISEEDLPTNMELKIIIKIISFINRGPITMILLHSNNIIICSTFRMEITLEMVG